MTTPGPKASTQPLFDWNGIFETTDNLGAGLAYVELTQQLNWSDGQFSEGVSIIRRSAIVCWRSGAHARAFAERLEHCCRHSPDERALHAGADGSFQWLPNGALALQARLYTTLSASQEDAAALMSQFDIFPKFAQEARICGLGFCGPFHLAIYDKQTYARDDIARAMEHALIDLATPAASLKGARKAL